MRYIKIALIITLAMVLLTGCSADTTLITEEDGFFLQFNEAMDKPIDIGYHMLPTIDFRSIDEMLHTIRSGRFNKTQMKELVRFDRDDYGRVILFDLDHVLEPVYPDGYEDLSVVWYGDSYSFKIRSSLASSQYDFFTISQEKYHNENTEHYQHFDQFRECDRVFTENRDGIEVTVFDYTSSNSDAYGDVVSKRHRLCTYTLADDNTELFIVEFYDPNVDLQVPAYIHLFGKSTYGYFQTRVDVSTTRPTYEWLLSFDLKPYNFTEPTHYHTSMYSITAKDGKYILTPTVPLPEEYQGDLCYVRAFIHPKFTSIKEMRQGILEGPISQYELRCLVHASSDADHSIEICDPNHLYEFTAPEEFHLKYIIWSGNSYNCHLTSDNEWGGIDCYNKKDYSESFNKGYKDFLSNSLVTITEQRTTSDRLATVYYGHTGVAKLKYICYELHVGDKTMYIQEEYLLEIEDNRSPVSSDVPSSIQFWGTQNGGYFQGTFFDFTERPSIQWLSQFGIIPYEASASS